MKKFFLLAVIALLMGSCGQKKEVKEMKEVNLVEIAPSPVPSFLPLPSASSSPLPSASPVSEEPLSLSIDRTVDLDLAPFGMNAAYAEILNILRDKEKYIGKKVRILGHYTFFNNEKGEKIPIVMIVDSTACCSQGLEFRLEESSFPEDYPENGKRILLWGTIASRTAYNGYDYPYISAERYEVR